MRAKVKERRKKRMSGSFPAEIAASFLKLLYRVQLFQIKQNSAAFIYSFVNLKFYKFFCLRRGTSAGKGPDSRGRAHPLIVEAVLEQQDGSVVLLGAAAPPPMAAP